MPIRKASNNNIEIAAVANTKIAANAITSAKVIVDTGPRITNVIITNSDFTANSNKLYRSNETSYYRIVGTNFTSGSLVYAEPDSSGFADVANVANTVVFNSNSNLHVSFGNLTVGIQRLYVVNLDSKFAFRPNAFVAAL